MKLVAMMICRNEADRYLDWVLASLNEFCDEIRAVDDASDDTTNTLLKMNGVKVKRNDRPMFYEHEGRARNQLLDWALEGEPTHLLAIDCDEIVADGQAVRQAIGQTNRHGAWLLNIEEIWKADENWLYRRVDGKWGAQSRSPILFEVPARRPQKWKIADRALACGREPMMVARQGIRSREPVLTSVFHFGWSCQSDRQARYDRYVRYDNGAHHASDHLKSIMFGDDRVVLTPRPWPAELGIVKAAMLDRINRC